MNLRCGTGRSELGTPVVVKGRVWGRTDGRKMRGLKGAISFETSELRWLFHNFSAHFCR